MGGRFDLFPRRLVHIICTEYYIIYTDDSKNTTPQKKNSAINALVGKESYVKGGSQAPRLHDGLCQISIVIACHDFCLSLQNHDGLLYAKTPKIGKQGDLMQSVNLLPQSQVLQAVWQGHSLQALVEFVAKRQVL